MFSAPHRTGPITSLSCSPSRLTDSFALAAGSPTSVQQPLSISSVPSLAAAAATGDYPTTTVTLCSTASGTNSKTTTAYTYETFFASDGRSKKPPLTAVLSGNGGLPAEAATVETVGGVVVATAGVVPPSHHLLAKPKYVCTECGKHYATSSNLSRHRQTHRTLDSTNAKK